MKSNRKQILGIPDSSLLLHERLLTRQGIPKSFVGILYTDPAHSHASAQSRIIQ